MRRRSREGWCWEAEGGLAKVVLRARKSTLLAWIAVVFTVFRRRRRGSTFNQQHTKSHHQCQVLRVQHEPPPLKKNTRCQKLPRKTKTCSSSFVSLMIPVQGLPSQPSPTSCSPSLMEKTQVLQQAQHTVKSLSSQQAHAGERTPLNFKQTRNYVIQTPAQCKRCSHLAPLCSGRLRLCCSVFRAPQGFFQRTCGAFHMRLSRISCRTTLLFSMCCSPSRS